MKIFKYIWMFLSTLIFLSCTDDRYPNNSSNFGGKVKLEFSSMGMGSHLVTSRGTSIKDQEEKEIHNLHVFFFDNITGEYLTPSSSSSSEEGKSYRYLEGGNTTLLIDGDQFLSPNDVDIHVLANLEDNTINVGADGIPIAKGKDGANIPIKNRTDLLNYEYLPYNEITFTTMIPKNGLPMYGNAQGDFTQSGGAVIDVKLKSLMSRVDFNIRLNPTDINNDLKYPILQITAVEMHNMPAGVLLKEEDYNTETTVTPICNKEGNANITLKTGEERSFHFYVFEHKRQTNGKSIPEGVTDEFKQRYKPTLAKDDAAYVLLKGQYIENNGHPYTVSYKLYLGKNHTDDFNLIRNCKYINNISVMGITAIDHPDNPEDVYGLDARVTVSREDNEYYITILRERRHDAHFNVTPMDVYIPGSGSVTVTIPDADGVNKWIRLEQVEGEPNKEGYGKRDYFTTDLLTATLNNTENKSCTVDGTSLGLTVRRIYLYIDENASTKSRNVPLEIYFTPKDGITPSSPTQILDIKQAGLLKATINDGGEPVTVYMEMYEEYLDYYDPMSDFNTGQIYEGLQWGADNKEIGGIGSPGLIEFEGTYCSQNFTKGNEFTPFILNRLAELGGTVDQRKMTLNDIPQTAAAYAYNKNKRNPDGSVTNVVWYLPGIREIEQCLLHYYNDYPEFQGNFYWSSAAGEEKNFRYNSIWPKNIYNEDLTKARATKVIYYPGGENNPNAPSNVNWEGEYCYVKSGVNDDGWRPRTEKLRIRCFRIEDGVTE